MSIPFGKYVQITSGVVGGAQATARELILRLYSNNAKIGLQSVYEFSTDDLTPIGALFGTDSEEYKRAVQYAGFVSPLITRPKKISYARFSRTAVASAIYGNTNVKSLTAIQALTAGNLAIVLDNVTYNIASINLSTASSLSAAATALQTAINALSPPALQTATVIYDATSRRFIVTLAITGTDSHDFYFVQSNTQDIAVPFGLLLSNTQDIAVPFGLLLSNANGFSSPSDAIKVIGGPAELPVDAFNRVTGISSNFGTFLFMDRTLTTDETVAVATANKARNNEFMFLVRTMAASAATLQAALATIGGVAITLVTAATDDYADQIPGAVQAAIDYTARNGVLAFMFRQMPGAYVSVSGSDYATWDALAINYYGQTERNGQLLSFYQDGVLQGLATDPSDMNVYSNEQWFKDRCAVDLINAQLSLGQIPADDTGIAITTGVLDNVINDALFNGVINVGKPLTNLQKTFITEQSGDPRAWYKVQSVGWYLTVTLQTYVDGSGKTKWQAVYVLLYSKNDQIRKFVGTHQLV